MELSCSTRALSINPNFCGRSDSTVHETPQLRRVIQLMRQGFRLAGMLE